MKCVHAKLHSLDSIMIDWSAITISSLECIIANCAHIQCYRLFALSPLSKLKSSAQLACTRMLLQRFEKDLLSYQTPIGNGFSCSLVNLSWAFVWQLRFFWIPRFRSHARTPVRTLFLPSLARTPKCNKQFSQSHHSSDISHWTATLCVVVVVVSWKVQVLRAAYILRVYN